jgi:hypothetical protein
VVEVGPLDLAPLRRARSDLSVIGMCLLLILISGGDRGDLSGGFGEVVDLVGNIIFWEV